MEDLEKLKYTEQVTQLTDSFEFILYISFTFICALVQVVLEAMRMYPSATPIYKECPPEGISLDGHFIPPGIPISVCYKKWDKY